MPKASYQILDYLDGTGSVHITKPRESVLTDRKQTWKKKGESLKRSCTAKGKKEGAGGRMVRFMVAIAYNKGVIKCHHYVGPVNSETCKSFIDEQFYDMFKNSANPKRKLFLQNGDPSQNSKTASDAMDSVGCRLFKISPCSPDLNFPANIINRTIESMPIRIDQVIKMKEQRTKY